MEQQFSIIPDGLYMIISKANGQALADSSPAADANYHYYPISQKQPDSRDVTQLWEVADAGSGFIKIRSHSHPIRYFNSSQGEKPGVYKLALLYAEGDDMKVQDAGSGYFSMSTNEIENSGAVTTELTFRSGVENAEDQRWVFIRPEILHVSYPGANGTLPAPGTSLNDLKVAALRLLFSLDDRALRRMIPDQFRLQMKNSKSVKAQFFPDALPCISPLQPETVDDLAVAWVCEAVAHTTIRDFNTIIDKNAVDRYVKSDEMTKKRIEEGRNLYQHLFPLYCTDKTGKVRVKDYLDDKSLNWEDEIYRYLTSKDFINNKLLLKKVQPNWMDDINLLIFAYKQFNPAPNRLQNVLRAWRHHFSDPAIAEAWPATDFVPWTNFEGGNDIMGIISSEASVKLAVDSKGNKKTDAGGNVNLGVVKFENYAYGLDLRDWIIKNKPKTLHFWNNIYPGIYEHPITSPVVEAIGNVAKDLGQAQGRVDNARWQAQTHPFGCFIAGTPILLQDGSSVAVDGLKAGLAILSRDGHTTFSSEEKILIDVDVPVHIFGFDDGVKKDTPFFSGGHLFYTPEGWKAVAPETALRENPHIKVGALRPGDVVYRVKSTTPFAYEQVRIKDFTVDVLPAGSYLHSVHLVDGLQYYHANGYLVSANYPQMTEGRLRYNFASLSDRERAFLQSRLAEMLPLLEHAIGPFITMPMLRALQQAEHG